MLNDPLFNLPGNNNGQYSDVTYAGTTPVKKITATKGATQ